MKNFMSICLDKNGRIPIYTQLGDALMRLIAEGILESDLKLPPIRKMAKSLKINNSTVVNAYKYLESKKVVYSILGSGTFVAPPDVKKTPTSRRERTIPYAVCETAVVTDFTSPSYINNFFPEEEINAAFSAVINKEKGKAFSLTSPYGDELFINAVSKQLQNDGISTESDGIFITGSFTRGLELAVSAFINKGDYVILEKPVSYSRMGVYAEIGAKILQAKMESDGIELEVFESLLKLYRPKAVHISTYFQIPTNATYSQYKKKAILQLCHKYGAIIIEEDIYSDLFCGDKRITLKSLDCMGCVIYVKSITKSCLPWLNVNIVLLPKKLAISAENTAFPAFCSNDAVQTKILRELFISNSFDRILKNIVNINECSYKKCAEIFNDQLGDFIEFDSVSTGIGFWMNLKKGESLTLAKLCAQKGVLISPGNIYFGGGDSRFRLSAMCANNTALLKGVGILRDELTSLAYR